MMTSTLHIFLFIFIIILAWIFAMSDRQYERVKLNHQVALGCFGNCSGSVRWFVAQKPGAALARCDRTSCVSEREGYELSHAQYLRGNQSLIIRSADYRSRSKWYVCECDGVEICRKNLRLDAVQNQVQIERNGSLTLDVPVLEDVKVLFNRTSDVGGTPAVICEVTERQVRPQPDYEDRVQFGFYLTLNHLQSSDSGVYSVWDTNNDELISTYNVTVMEVHGKNWISRLMEPSEALWTGLTLGLVVGLVVGWFLPWIIGFLRSKLSRIRKKKNPDEDEGGDEDMKLNSLNST